MALRYLEGITRKVIIFKEGGSWTDTPELTETILNTAKIYYAENCRSLRGCYY